MYAAGGRVRPNARRRALDLETDSLESADLDNINGFIGTRGGTAFGELTFERTSDELGDVALVQ